MLSGISRISKQPSMNVLHTKLMCFLLTKVWSSFKGYNEVKRKKLKELPLSSSALEGHAAAIMGLCLKPCMETTTALKAFCDDIKGLAECFLKYSVHLKLQLQQQTTRQKQNVPARLVWYVKTSQFSIKRLLLNLIYVTHFGQCCD